MKNNLKVASKKFRRGQMKIQQMAFMLIAVMIFFALVGLLIFSIGFSGLKEKARLAGRKCKAVSFKIG
ncbi:hypothetical protein HYT91_03070 [Candidatus Pacearchaeota archaeon]|nr:hypothetical protein [Candidatus Pacearchaeota archaeon]